MPTWAAIAAKPPPVPTAAQQMQGLRNFLSNKPESSVLLHTLGSCLQPLLGATSRISKLLNHAVIICIDTEAWTRNTDEMTEIGLAVYEKKDMEMIHSQAAHINSSSSNRYEHLGDFGENLLREITFHHLRIAENCHLKGDAKWMKGASGNRFGHSRFVTFPEARYALDQLFNQAIFSLDPELAGCKKPVILVGHAMFHDQDNLRRNELNYDWYKHGTIVKKIDTQPLAKSTKTWFNPEAPSNNVGLPVLTNILGFEHEDAHTACNDAARTLISAIQMALPNECKEGHSKDMQQVAWEIESHSLLNSRPRWGTEFCCTRCGRRDHNNSEENPCQVPVHCSACLYAKNCPSSEHGHTHTELYCMHVAEYRQWARRKDNAERKHNSDEEFTYPDVPAGSHPGSP